MAGMIQSALHLLSILFIIITLVLISDLGHCIPDMVIKSMLLNTPLHAVSFDKEDYLSLIESHMVRRDRPVILTQADLRAHVPSTALLMNKGPSILGSPSWCSTFLPWGWSPSWTEAVPDWGPDNRVVFTALPCNGCAHCLWVTGWSPAPRRRVPYGQSLVTVQTTTASPITQHKLHRVSSPSLSIPFQHFASGYLLWVRHCVIYTWNAVLRYLFTLDLSLPPIQAYKILTKKHEKERSDSHRYICLGERRDLDKVAQRYHLPVQYKITTY